MEDMSSEQIEERLAELFREHRVVFWNDANREFEDHVSNLSLAKVEAVRPRKIGQLKTKVLIELEKPSQKFLVYKPAAESRYEDDWLLDIRLYSYRFSADRASMIVNELGIGQHYLREHINKRAKFFKSKDRLAGLKERVETSDIEADIDRKIMAVLVKSEGDQFFDILHSLFSRFPDNNDPQKEPEGWGDIVKFGLADVFWKLVGEQFGYREEHPTLQKLLCSLFVTDLYAKSGNEYNGLRQFVLPAQNEANAVVCLNGWRDSVRLAESYDRVACAVEEFLKISKHISELPDEVLMNMVTFVAVEKMCAKRLKEMIVAQEAPFDAKAIRQYVRKRQDMYWANRRIKDTPEAPRTAFFAVYEAIMQAATIMELRNTYASGFSFDSAKDGFDQYTKELSQFDRAYRLFCEASEKANQKGWDVLKELKELVEQVYANSFLEPLSLAWEKVADLSSWHIEGVESQHEFWERFPKKEIGEKKSAVYVVISDAFRYEAAAELAEQLNGKYRFSARLDAMLGCVPSYTVLGMAALLPHKDIEMTEKGDAIVDSMTCTSIAQRSKLLDRYNGAAIDAKEFTGMSREKARGFLRDKDVVYIYHNTIDSTGDDVKTETKTFSAVRAALDELGSLVSRLVNDLNPRYVFVTADHGFVYTRHKPDDVDRSKIPNGSAGIVKTNKRFVLGTHITDIPDSRTGLLSDTAGIDKGSGMRFVIPKGMALYHFAGGARFFHGGMSLQEIVIPVILVEQVRGKQKDKTQEKTVSVQVLGTSHRITTGKHRFKFLQLEAVSDRIKPLTAKIGIYDGATPVSDIHTVTFDSSSDDMSQRTKELIFTLQNVMFDSKKTYRLILRDAPANREIEALPVCIDRSFTEDF